MRVSLAALTYVLGALTRSLPKWAKFTEGGLLLGKGNVIVFSPRAGLSSEAWAFTLAV